MSPKCKLVLSLLVLSNSMINIAYCRPQEIGIDDEPFTPQFSDDEKELMKNPLFPILFRQFLSQVSKIAQTHLASQVQSPSFEASQTEQQSQDKLVNAYVDNIDGSRENENIEFMPRNEDKRKTKDENTVTQNAMEVSSASENIESDNSFNQKSAGSVTQNINIKHSNQGLQNSQVITNQNGILKTTQESEKTAGVSNVVKDDEIENESEATANYNSIKRFQEVFGKKITTTTESFKNSENEDINETNEDITNDSINFQRRKEVNNSQEGEQYDITTEIPRTEPKNQDSEEIEDSDESEEGVKEKLKQAQKNVKYQFATRVDDNLHGNFQQREETREGGVITGSYAYDDGNILRSVTYIADEKGYRIIKDEISPSVKAIQEKNSQAKVMTYYNGHKVQYDITQGNDDEDEE